MYLLDSSAWLVHIFSESGVEQVNQLFDDEQAEVSISTLSLPEVFMRLKALGRGERWHEVWTTYQSLFTRILPTDEVVAHRAIELRIATPDRLPTIDALIAATAAVHTLTLVHRDPHMAAIPNQFLDQIRLPEK